MIKKTPDKTSDEKMTEVFCISINPRLLDEAHSHKALIEVMFIPDFEICFYPDTNGQMRIQKILFVDSEATNLMILGKTSMYYWLAKDIETYLKHKGSIVKKTSHIWGLALINGHFDPHLKHH